jgi:hypothetical protein
MRSLTVLEKLPKIIAESAWLDLIGEIVTHGTQTSLAANGSPLDPIQRFGVFSLDSRRCSISRVISWAGIVFASGGLTRAAAAGASLTLRHQKQRYKNKKDLRCNVNHGPWN